MGRSTDCNNQYQLSWRFSELDLIKPDTNEKLKSSGHRWEFNIATIMPNWMSFISKGIGLKYVSFTAMQLAVKYLSMSPPRCEHQMPSKSYLYLKIIRHKLHRSIASENSVPQQTVLWWNSRNHWALQSRFYFLPGSTALCGGSCLSPCRSGQSGGEERTQTPAVV